MSEPVSRVMRYLKLLKEDPTSVHRAFLQGQLAKLSVRTHLHIVGNNALDRWDYIHRLETTLRYYASGPDGEQAQAVLDGLPPAIDIIERDEKLAKG